MKKAAPWPTPFRGVLAMSDNELSAFIRDSGITFPVLTPEAKADVQRENEYLEAHESGAVREAFESGALRRKKPGRRKTTKPTMARRRRGRPSSHDEEILKALRRDHPGDCKAEFRAVLEENGVPETHWARRYRDAARKLAKSVNN
jgi:hypothetical protein